MSVFIILQGKIEGVPFEEKMIEDKVKGVSQSSTTE
jgi:hypothetical protein